MRPKQNRTLSLKHFFKRNGRRIAVFTCGIYLVHIVAPVYYAKLQAELYMTVSGKVVDKETGEGIEGAPVIILPKQGLVQVGKFEFGATDKAGKYTLNMLPPGDYLIFVHPPKNSNYAADTAPREISVIRGKNLKNMNFELEIGGSISGLLLEQQSGKPLTNVDVMAIQVNDEGIPINFDDINTSTANDNGEYRIQNLKKGPYLLAALPKGNAFTLNTNKILVNKGAETPNVHLNIDFSSKSSFKGVIRDSSTSNPVKDAFIGVIGQTGGGWNQTSETGSYEIQGFSPGLYSIIVLAKDFQVQRLENVEIGSNEQKAMDFSLQPELKNLSKNCLPYKYNKLSRINKGNFFTDVAEAQPLTEKELFEACEAKCEPGGIVSEICRYVDPALKLLGSPGCAAAGCIFGWGIGQTVGEVVGLVAGTLSVPITGLTGLMVGGLAGATAGQWAGCAIGMFIAHQACKKTCAEGIQKVCTAMCFCFGK